MSLPSCHISILIFGEGDQGGFNNQPATDNPTFEFYPPKGNGLPIHSQFLNDALNSNLFPLTAALPNGLVFVAANRLSMIYNWKTNKERRLPSFPNGVRVNYPASAGFVLLPLTIENNWTPEVLACGGTTANVDGLPTKLSSQYKASSQCVRMVLTDAGIAKGWSVEQMPEGRIMVDMILTPDGKVSDSTIQLNASNVLFNAFWFFLSKQVLLINGAKTGVSGYGNVLDKIGNSNADHPAYAPILYDPLAKAGSRFRTGFPSSGIERLYHSSA